MTNRQEYALNEIKRLTDQRDAINRRLRTITGLQAAVLRRKAHSLKLMIDHWKKVAEGEKQYA